MKRMIYLLLMFLTIGSANANAQVLIGGDMESDPHPGAILDLQSTKGLLLSNVVLFDVSEFQLADVSTAASAKGMLVYNTSNSTIGGQGEGIYVWNGTQWKFAAIFGDVTTRVTNITVNGSATVVAGNQISFTATILPVNATNTNVNWLIINGTGSGYITSDGVFTADRSGTVAIRATAADGSGVYGEKQITITPADNLITNITLSAAGDATELDAGSGLQMTAEVEPTNATNKALSWSISAADATAKTTSVDQSGLVTGGGQGNVTVMASAKDGSGISGTYNLTIVQSTGSGTVTGSNGTYETYCYPNNVGCWMIQNSKEGTPTFTTYVNKSEGERGYYYNWSDATRMVDGQYTACPPGYTLPNTIQWEALASYMTSNFVNGFEKIPWFDITKLGGGYQFAGSWFNWNDYGYWWSEDSDDSYCYYTGGGFQSIKLQNVPKNGRAHTVRCIRN